MQASPLLHASWSSHQSAEGVTPSVLPVVQVNEKDYQKRRASFSVLLASERKAKVCGVAHANPALGHCYRQCPRCSFTLLCSTSRCV